MGRARTARVALVGLGEIGSTAHLPALMRSPRVEVTHLVDPDVQRRAAAHARVPDARAYASVDQLIADLDGPAGNRRPEAVVLATPPWITTGLARQFLLAGLFVLAEKPIATSVLAAAELSKLPDAQRARLQIGLTYRHDPAIGVLRRWISEGPLTGPLLVRVHVYDERRDPGDPDHERRMRATLEHGSPLVHEGAHAFDWLAVLLADATDRPPKPSIMDSWAMRTDPSLPAANLIGGRLAYPGGTTALVEFGWLTEALPTCELTFLGRHALARLDGMSFDLSLTTAAGTESISSPGERGPRCFDLQLHAFLDLIDGSCGVAVPGLSEGLAALELSERVAEAST